MRLLIPFVLVALVGCGGPTPKQTNDLKQLTLAYHDYITTSLKGPKDDKEFLAWAIKSKHPAQVVIQDVQRGEWVVYYGVRLTELTKGTGNTVLAYHKDVPTKGGLVGMADGTVRTMTADEFAKSPKAGK